MPEHKGMWNGNIFPAPIMAPSTNWIGNQAFNLKMVSSNLPWVTNNILSPFFLSFSFGRAPFLGRFCHFWLKILKKNYIIIIENLKKRN